MSCSIEGVEIRLIKAYEDERGWLVEMFRSDEVADHLHPVMNYMSMTKPGVARGPHEHVYQTDMFCFAGPSTFRLYLWDIRPQSPTNGVRFVAEFGECQPAVVVVPPGVVHAYWNVGSVDGLVLNAPNKLYRGAGRTEEIDEIRWEDRDDPRFKLD